jgi:hypothetical protein
MPPLPDAALERRQGGAESWWFDFAGAGIGGYARLEYRPVEKVAWWWAAVVGTEAAPLVAIRAHDVPLPPRGTDVRADGIWASVTCETPLEHWSVGLECFGVALDDPLEAWRGERGDVVPFGLDLEWEAAGAPMPGPGGGYGQWCDVSGEVLVGDLRIPVECGGFRSHGWGASAPLPDLRVAVRPLWAETGFGVEWGADRLPSRVAGMAVDRGRVSPVAVPGRPVVHAVCEGGDGRWGWASLAAPAVD